MHIGLWGDVNNPGWLRIQFMRATSTMIRKLLLIFAVIGIIALLSGALMYLALDHFGSYWSASWWSLQHLLDPASLAEDEGFTQKFVGVILVVIGLILLAGILLAITLEVVDRSLNTLGEVQIPVRSKNHLVIVGWNDSVPEAVRALSRQGGRHRYAPRQHSDEIVILAPVELKDQSSNMRTVLRSRSDARTPRILFGDLASDEGFDLVSARDAWAIFITPTLRPGQPPTVVDADSMRIAVALASYLEGRNDDQAYPSVDVSFFWGEDVDAAEAIHPREFNGIVWDRVWSGMMALGLTTPDWGYAIRVMLSRPDPTLHPCTDASVEGVAFCDLYVMLDCGAPIALRTTNASGEVSIRLPAGPDDLVRPGEVPIVMEMDPDAQLIFNPIKTQRGAIEPIALPLPDPHPSFTILAIGSNHRLQALLWELATRTQVKYRVIAVSSIPASERKKNLSRAISEIIEIEFVDAPLYDTRVLEEAVATHQPDTIIVSGDWDESTGDQSVDAEAAMNYLRLRSIVGDSVPVYAITYGANYSEIINQAASREMVPDTGILVSNALAVSIFQPDLIPVLNSLFSGDQVLLQNVILDAPDEKNRRFDNLYQGLLASGGILAGYVTPDREVIVPPPRNTIIPTGSSLLIIRQPPDLVRSVPERLETTA